MVSIDCFVNSLSYRGLAISPYRSARIEALVQKLSQEDYDIVGLQEVWMRSDYEKLRMRLKPHLSHSIYHYSGVVGSGLAFFSRFPIVDSWMRPFMLSGRPEMIIHGDWYAGKGIGVTVVQVSKEYQVAILNTHVSHGEIYSFFKFLLSW